MIGQGIFIQWINQWCFVEQDYFQQFYGMEPYLTITAEQITYIKENFDIEYVKIVLLKYNDISIALR